MSSSREASPDWLRSFQAPTGSTVILSTDSDPCSNDGHHEEDVDSGDNVDEPKSVCKSNAKWSNKSSRVENGTPKKKKTHDCKEKEDVTGGDALDVNVAEEKTIGKNVEPCGKNSLLWTLSSDSESCPDDISVKELLLRNKKVEDANAVIFDTSVKTVFNEPSKLELSADCKLELEDCSATGSRKTKSPRKIKGSRSKLEVEEEETAGKHPEHQASSSRLPLVLAEKVHRSKALVECEGESIELSGDMGAVGRVVISDAPSGSHEMFLDLKGTIYKTAIVPSRTFCVVSFGQTEAKVEAIMNDFIQLKPQSNVYEAETMVEGTLEGFSFDSDDEADKMTKAAAPPDKNEGPEDQPSRKRKRVAEETSGLGQKKRKAGGGKPPKKATKKAPARKKGRAKK